MESCPRDLFLVLGGFVTTVLQIMTCGIFLISVLRRFVPARLQILTSGVLLCSTECLTNRYSAFDQMMIKNERNIDNCVEEAWKLWWKSMIVSNMMLNITFITFDIIIIRIFLHLVPVRFVPTRLPILTSGVFLCSTEWLTNRHSAFDQMMIKNREALKILMKNMKIMIKKHDRSYHYP